MNEFLLSEPVDEEEINSKFVENEDSLNQLAEREIRDIRLGAWERFYIRAGKFGAVMVLGTMGIYFGAAEGHKMKEPEKIGYEVLGTIGAGCVAGLGWGFSRVPRSKAQKNALEAQPIAISINGTVPPWIERRKEQRSRDQKACGVNPFFEEDLNNKKRAKKFTE
jgi:hypothetical protein